MAQRETELLAVLRELAQCDLHAPEDYFDGDRLLKQGRPGQLGGAQEDKEFRVALSTFWRPANVAGYEAAREAADPRYSEALEAASHAAAANERALARARKAEQEKVEALKRSSGASERALAGSHGRQASPGGARGSGRSPSGRGAAALEHSASGGPRGGLSAGASKMMGVLAPALQRAAEAAEAHLKKETQKE